MNDKMRKPKTEKPYIFNGFRTFDAEEVLKAGGSTKFSNLMGFDPKKLSKLDGSPISELDYQNALSLLSK
jgi:hypothetical protein